jgi:hypothetical protein
MALSATAVARLVACSLLLGSGVAAACGSSQDGSGTSDVADAGFAPPDAPPLPPPPPPSADATVGDASPSVSDASDGSSDAGRLMYAATVLADAPLVYYRLGEKSGVTAANAAPSGAPFNATYEAFDAGSMGRPGLLDRDAGGAGDTDTSVLCQNLTSVTLPISAATAALKLSGAFTIEAWVTLTGTSTTTYTVVSTKGSGKDGYSFGVAVTKLFLACHGKNNFGSQLVVPSDGSPHYIAAVFDGTTSVTFYLDGQSAVVNAPSPPVVLTYATTSELSLCSFPPEAAMRFPWSGLVDEVAIYPTALTPSQISTHRRAGGE